MPATAAEPASTNNKRSSRAPLTIALVGNPNSGKTTLFNSLTGLRQKVANYPGVTVERKTGVVRLPDGSAAMVVDLPGLYSLMPHSPDERVAREVLLGIRHDTPRPDVVINVVDSTNLERNLYLTAQVMDLGIPMLVCLTLADAAVVEGIEVDSAKLEELLGAPVVWVSALSKQGIDKLIARIPDARSSSIAPAPELSTEAQLSVERLAAALQNYEGLSQTVAHATSLHMLVQSQPGDVPDVEPEVVDALKDARSMLATAPEDLASATIAQRYSWIGSIASQVVTRSRKPNIARNKLDRVALHPLWGYVLFGLIMVVMFQSIFSWVEVPKDWITSGIDKLGDLLIRYMPAGDLRDLIKSGILGGVGNALVFLPQILVLFFFICLLEDTGYMARAAFLMDRMMSRVGLHGRSFIPLLSSFACAIPGIMATRTISDQRSRLITILVAPLMSCSARIPVYALMIGAFIPAKPLIKIDGITLLNLPGVTLTAMYLLGIVAAAGVAWLLNRTALKTNVRGFVMELPPYRPPRWKDIFHQVFERAWLFVQRAGTMILALSVLLWFFATFPRHMELPPEERVHHTIVGVTGHLIEPLIRPLGFDWKMGVGILSSFVAREVFVSAMGTVYSVDEAETDNGKVALRDKMRADRDPHTGKPIFTPLTAVGLMVYYVLAMQCMSTVAVVRRETNSWKWPIFQIVYMSALAWGGALLTRWIGLALGAG